MDTMQDADRAVPTFENIPAELNLTIAAHLDPDVPLDLRWSEMAQHEAQSRRPALRSLSLVSRSWAAALADLRWQVRRTLPLRGDVIDTSPAEPPPFPGRFYTSMLQIPNACWSSPATTCLASEQRSRLWSSHGGPTPTSGICHLPATHPMCSKLSLPQRASPASRVLQHRPYQRFALYRTR